MPSLGGACVLALLERGRVVRERRRRQEEHIEEGRMFRGRIVAMSDDFSVDLLLLLLQQPSPEPQQSSTPRSRVQIALWLLVEDHDPDDITSKLEDNLAASQSKITWRLFGKAFRLSAATMNISFA
jgi:hypothetical protein